MKEPKEYYVWDGAFTRVAVDKTVLKDAQAEINKLTEIIRDARRFIGKEEWEYLTGNGQLDICDHVPYTSMSGSNWVHATGNICQLCQKRIKITWRTDE